MGLLSAVAVVNVAERLHYCCCYSRYVSNKGHINMHCCAFNGAL